MNALGFSFQAVREVGCDVRVMTKRCNKLLGTEYRIAYGHGADTREFICGELGLSQLKRGVSPDELFMLEVDPAASDDEIWGE
ncbi:hypothetical protein LB553_00905 [Mesorhizobium sp. CA8]|uniref:hypothetical protein n=1 Tax=Mesorhizobium sp. CA8 TaxID=2876637 RepID=UPI001CCAD5D2|nr:hypothetical protein [Mesorhizobium sp. CA8]MBZ9759446.1 hypothetical protein [Mesorhizobium sp. CA8]